MLFSLWPVLLRHADQRRQTARDALVHFVARCASPLAKALHRDGVAHLDEVATIWRAKEGKFFRLPEQRYARVAIQRTAGGIHRALGHIPLPACHIRAHEKRAVDDAPLRAVAMTRWLARRARDPAHGTEHEDEPRPQRLTAHPAELLLHGGDPLLGVGGSEFRIAARPVRVSDEPGHGVATERRQRAYALGQRSEFRA